MKQRIKYFFLLTLITLSPIVGLQAQEGTLDYSWNANNWTDVSDTISATAGGNDVNLYLRYHSYSPNLIEKLGFQVDFPQGLTTVNTQSSHYSQTGFTNFYATVLPNAFRVDSAGADVTPSEAFITIPVHVNSYGQYRIDANSISETSKTLPVGAPAVLTVTSEVDFAAPVSSVTAGNTAPVKVKLPNGIVANGDLTVHLAYSTYNPLDFPAILPAFVTIPNGANEALIYIPALPTASEGNFLEISLTGTDNPFVSVTGSKAKAVIKKPRYAIAINPDIS